MSNPAALVDQSSLLTPAEMAEADRLTIQAGITGHALMLRAGTAVADSCRRLFPECTRIALLAGPGNNGGDAYVAATSLAEAGLDCTVFAAGERGDLSGDARRAAQGWSGSVRPLAAFAGEGFDLVVDGLFGAGLSRPVSGAAAEVIVRVNRSGLPVLAIDLPSGISGDSGQALGPAIEADATVTFFRRKPGHLLMPGRRHCGRTFVADIGIEPSVLSAIRPENFSNEPALWSEALLWPEDIGHKYDRGHAVVFSGGASRTGAARLSAMAALRGGAGLVTLFSPPSALLVNAAHLTAIMLKTCGSVDDLHRLLEDERFNAFVLGPGFGIGPDARALASSVLEAGRRLVLDADGITAFEEAPAELFDLVRRSSGDLVLTPHSGEFKRLFPDIAAKDGTSKLAQAKVAAELSGATLVLKGADTVIAAPDGRAAINATGTPWLATAGTGDVLAGLIAAGLAQRVPSFEAASAAVWIHGKAAEAFGPGLIAEDLPGLVPGVLRELQAARSPKGGSVRRPAAAP